MAPAAPYARFVQRWGEPALELGCGHGEPLLELVAAGLDVTGLDSSADMVELCRTEARRQGLRVQLVCQSMRAMDLKRRFRSIYLAGPTFQLVVDLADVATALNRIADHLTPDGCTPYPSSLPNPSIRARSGCGGSTSRPRGDPGYSHRGAVVSAQRTAGGQHVGISPWTIRETDRTRRANVVAAVVRRC